jgi:hypothetical protein
VACRGRRGGRGAVSIASRYSYEERYRERVVRNLSKKAAELGTQLLPRPYILSGRYS